MPPFPLRPKIQAKTMRLVATVLLAALLGACSIVYKLPTRQGNVLDQKDLDALQVGMSKEQVKFLLGTPVATSAFKPERWDYLGYYRNPRGKVYSRTVTLWFDKDSLTKMEGTAPVAKDNADPSSPDMDAIEKEEKKAATEAERAADKNDSGVVIQQKKKE